MDVALASGLAAAFAAVAMVAVGPEALPWGPVTLLIWVFMEWRGT